MAQIRGSWRNFDCQTSGCITPYRDALLSSPRHHTSSLPSRSAQRTSSTELEAPNFRLRRLSGAEIDLHASGRVSNGRAGPNRVQHLSLVWSPISSIMSESTTCRPRPCRGFSADNASPPFQAVCAVPRVLVTMSPDRGSSEDRARKCTSEIFSSSRVPNKLPPLVCQGVDLRTNQDLGGWSDLSMVMRYSHLSSITNEVFEKIVPQFHNAIHYTALSAI